VHDFELRRSVTLTDYGRWPVPSIRSDGTALRWVLGGEARRIEFDRADLRPSVDQAGAEALVRKLRPRELGERFVWHPSIDAVFVRHGPAEPRRHGRGADVETYATQLLLCDGRVARSLPAELKPLGWTRDGAGLLVRRWPAKGAPGLEVWTPPASG
jgi:hypothetical protein